MRPSPPRTPTERRINVYRMHRCEPALCTSEAASAALHSKSSQRCAALLWVLHPEVPEGRHPLAGGMSNIPHLLGLFSGCGTQQTETFVDLPHTTAVSCARVTAGTASRAQRPRRWHGSALRHEEAVVSVQRCGLAIACGWQLLDPPVKLATGFTTFFDAAEDALALSAACQRRLWL